MAAIDGVSARLRLGCAVAVLVSLSACGGGGGSGGGNVISTPNPAPAPTPVPTPTPTPAPTPTPTPPPTNFDTAEFRRSDGPGFHNAVTAWTAGITGAGATIAIIDTGIDIDSPEFAGRVHTGSADVASNRGVNAEDDHGTNVAMIAAAARDNTGIVGIAYGANILALRADEPGSCASETPEALDGCLFDDRDIATGVDRAVSLGAKVINLSLGGGNPSRAVTDAISRAAAAGVVIVVSAGNDGDSTEAGIDPAQPDPFASGLLAAGGANVIIVGSVTEAGEFSAFSNRAGNNAVSFLSARGEQICCVYDNGQIRITTDASGDRFVTVISGTSFAAPQVAGAVALLAQAFPNLSGRQIVEILLTSARDAGAAGIDATYGRGILDIARAFAPQGTTRLAGSGTALAPADNTGQASSPMGDAMLNVGIETIMTDKYDRAYAYDLGAGMTGASLRPRLLAAVETRGRRVAASAKGLSMAFTISDTGQQQGSVSAVSQLRLTPEGADAARVLAARVALQIDPATRLGFAFAESADGLVAQVQGQERPAFMIASSASGDNGFVKSADASFALRRQMGDWGLTLSAESGAAVLTRQRAGTPALQQPEDRNVRNFALSADRRFGPVEAALGLGWMAESDTVLGAYFHRALGASGAATMFADASASLSLAPQWRLGGAYRQGITRARQSGLVAGGSDFASNGWSFDITRAALFVPGDTLGLRLSQPLRVSGGGLNLNLPVSYDYGTQTAGFGIRRLSLAPQGREMMGEIAWRGPLMGGNAAASLFYRKDPGHYSAGPDDSGVAVRWTRDF